LLSALLTPDLKLRWSIARTQNGGTVYRAIN